MIAGIPKKPSISENHPDWYRAGSEPENPPGQAPRPNRVLHLAPEQGRYEQTYQHYRTLFLEQLGGLTHRELRMTHIFRPGVDGRPVQDSSGFVFWRGRFVLHTVAERRAHELLPELYRSFLRRPLELLSSPTYWTAADEHVIAALLHYACWSGRPVWIYSIAALLYDAGGHDREEFGGVFELAALQAAAESVSGPGAPNPRCDFYLRLVARPSPYFAYCLELLRGRTVDANAADPDEENPGAPTEESVSVKRLLWAEAAATGDAATEQYLLRRMTKNPPVDEDDLLDLFRSLAMRGKLYRATRLLLRHNRMFGEKVYASRVVLRLYLNNGKYLHYLRRLRALEEWPGRRSYFEALYCIHRLGLEQREEELMTGMTAGKRELKLPPDEARYRMRNALDVARSGHPAVLGASREDWGDLVENHYLLSSAGKSRGRLDGPLIRERYRLFQECVQNLLEARDEEPRNLERAGFYFRTLMWTFEQYRDRPELDQLWPIVRGLAGENLAVRLFFGVLHFERDETELARRYLEGLGGSHPALLHARGELAMLAGDFTEAERIYRLLLSAYPDSATLLYNLALILERASRLDEALQLFRQVLELEPRNQEAYDKIQLLTG
ncbi:MAG: tetratricopeptide repeat protein [bacterium]|nr:tetratricopeptide repeat protein [bacterium]